jgi:ATP-dependent RNA helicase RhlB
MTEKYLTIQRFTEFELDPALLRGIEEAGFEYCTPIQAETLPHLLRGQDVAGQAKTGTGKTAAFLVALFQHLLTHAAAESRTDSQPRALVLAPTRELAIQIDDDARQIGKYLDMRFRLIYGGTGYESQRRDLKSGVDVLIGTPGRIIDYLKQGIFSLDALQVMVLDEADRMFDLGFIRDIRYLFRKMPKATERLNMLFSATLSLRVNELAYEHMNNPRVVKIESDKLTVDQVTQRVFFPSNEDKLPLLLGLLKDAGDTRTLVFVNTKYQSERVARRLLGSGFNAGVLSGDVPQKKRESLLERFKNGEINVLVATDVAARGLHIPDVSLVVNYDLPQDSEDYVHRIGRTARAGAAGDAISFACETYAFSLPEIEGFIGHKIEPTNYDRSMLVQPNAGDSFQPEAGERPARRQGRGRHRNRERSDDRRRESRNAGRRTRAESPVPESRTPESQALDSLAPKPSVSESPAPGSLASESPAREPDRELRPDFPRDSAARQQAAERARSDSGSPHKPQRRFDRRSQEVPAVG